MSSNLEYSVELITSRDGIGEVDQVREDSLDELVLFHHLFKCLLLTAEHVGRENNREVLRSHPVHVAPCAHLVEEGEEAPDRGHVHGVYPFDYRSHLWAAFLRLLLPERKQLLVAREREERFGHLRQEAP
eukprot:CAMPEP_0180247062 /NCGR_PEP_ID=MMETSP0987-20121128/35932_1 /TAXON_ID=697907 /ORGANISM="non described non described, Strain CCMP2293" /LENGTH=129 /DNA_ID=CAMNT_0022214969 /DNA_START=88 /DNA_END=478 /DNA_ORIENTATION=-